MKAIRLLILVGLFGGAFFVGRAQTLIMNEVSNGTSGSQEYVEFVVVSDTVAYDCNSATPPCIDIRGWIFDDNSGYHGTAGIASGAVRFSFDALWSCVPLGTIIVIYNDADPNTSLPADDISLSDGNCTIIAPISNTSLFEKNSTTPGAAACSYPSTGWTAGGNWTFTALANASDCARIVNLNGCEVFSVCYGSTDNQNTLIYFSPSGTGTTYYFNDTDPFSQGNWSSGSASTSQTPGAPNNAANAAYIAQYNNACNPITPLIVTPSSLNAGCSCDGSASAAASGSIGPYSYQWSNGATTSSISGLCAGTYSCIVTSHIGCSETVTVTITSLGTPVDADAGSTQTINCTNTTAVLNGSSTTVGATFSWAGPGIVSGGGTATPTVNAAGVYTLTTTSGLCPGTATVSVTSNTTTPNVTVAPPSALTCAITTVTLNGSSTTGGVAFQWTAGPATANYSVSSPGTYTLTVTDPSNGCTNTVTATVSQNIITPNVSIAPPSTLTCATTTVTLNGSSTTSGATFQWTAGPATANYNVSSPGTYTLTVTDPFNSCTNTVTTTVSQNNTAPNISIAPPPTLTCATTTVTLNGSSTTVGATFQWTSGSATANYSVSSPGVYTLTVTDPANSCTNTLTATVSQVTTPPDASIAPPAILTCASPTTTLLGSSTTAGVTFQWLAGGPATNNYNVFAPGTYSLVVTDPSNSCTNTVTTTVSSNTVTPDASIATPGMLNCAITSITLSGSSLTSGATFQWTGGPASANYIVSVADTYTLTVTDPSNGCVKSVTVAVTSNTTLPDITIVPPDTITCATTSVTLSGSSTVADPIFQWDNGPSADNYTVSAPGTYTLVVADLSNDCISFATVTVISNITAPDVSIAPPALITCTSPTVTLSGSSNVVGAMFQWTGGPATSNYDITSIGTYTLTATDPANGCTNFTTTNVSSDQSFPDVSIATPGQIKCNPSVVTLNGSSATAGATFQWAGGPANANYTVNAAGTYTLTVTDPVTGCTSSTVATVTTNTVLPDAGVDPVQQLNCLNSSVTIMGTSTTPGVTYQWTNGPGTADYTVTAAGTYTLSVTDPNNGCTNSLIATVSTNITPPNVSIASPDVLSCATTTITLVGSSNTQNAVFAWTNGPATANYDVVIAGDYTLTVTDPANGCTSVANASVTSNTTPPAIAIDSAAALTCTNTIVTLNGSSATSGAVFQWTSGPATATYGVSAPGNYTLTATDPVNGCSSTGTVHVSQIGTFTPGTSVLSNVTCNGGNNGSVQINIAGGQAPFTLVNVTSGTSISNISAFPLVINTLAASHYDFTISDNNGCVENTSADVSQPLPIQVAIPQSVTICFGDQTTLSTQVTGGTSPYSYNWLPVSATTASLTTSPAVTTIYSVTVADVNNCTAATQTTVSVTPLPSADFVGLAQSGCAEYCTSLTPDLPQNQQWSYTWMFSDGGVVNDYTGDYCFNRGGIYGASLTVTNDDNCSVTYSVNSFITVYDNPKAAFSYNPTEISILEPSVNFENQSTNASNYLWTFDDGTTSIAEDPFYTYLTEGEHLVTLVATNGDGCIDSVYKIIVVQGEYAVYVPNAFTPNGDKDNEFFRPYGVGVDEDHYEMMIFDRWGMMLYKTTDWEKGAWDGTFKGNVVQQDTYIYKINVRPKDETLGSPKTLAGHVHLVR